ncbi:MAG: hypothetical protein AABX33_04975 [Nanoarchaeota archaeon]
MKDPTRRDSQTPTLNPRTAQIILSIFGNVDLDEGQLVKLADEGLLRFFGDAFLYRGKVILVGGDKYGDLTPLSCNIDKTTPVIPFSDTITYVQHIDDKQPRVLSGRYDPTGILTTTASLDTIAYLELPIGGTQDPLIRGHTDIVRSKRSHGEAIDRVVDNMTDFAKPLPQRFYDDFRRIVNRSNLIMYRPGDRENPAETFNNIFEYRYSQLRQSGIQRR